MLPSEFFKNVNKKILPSISYGEQFLKSYWFIKEFTLSSKNEKQFFFSKKTS
jgi:hypothetical protein